MAKLSCFAVRTLASTLFVTVGIAGLLPARQSARAQTTDNTTGSSGSQTTGSQTSDSQGTAKTGTDKTRSDNNTSDKTTVVKRPRPVPTPPPGNPIVKVNPDDGSGNDIKDYNKDGTRKLPRNWSPKDFGDFHPGADDPRFVKKAKMLPIFGYDFFASVRQLYDARQANLYRQYPGLRPTTSQSQRNRTQRSAVSGNNRSTGQQNNNQRDTNPSGDNTPNPNGSRNNGNNTDNTDNTDAAQQGDNSTDRSTRAAGSDMGSDDNTADNAPVRRRTVNQANDDGLSDTGDNPSQAQRNTGLMQSDDNGDDDNTQMSQDDVDQQAALQRQNQRRMLLGLPPVDDDTQDSDDTRRDDTRNGNTGNNNTRGNTRDRNNRYTDQYGYPYDRNQLGSNQPNPRTDSQEQVDAFTQIADPLTQLTHNILASPPANYQLSGGDTVIVSYSNPAMAPRELTQVVDAQGMLTLNEAGHINVAGMTLEQADQAIKRRLSRFYKNVDVNVSLKKLRTIAVMVGGKAYMPGNYAVPAVTTAFQLLYVCGGPTKEGSLRNIQIRRQNRVFTFDFYKAMTMAATPIAAGTAGSATQYQQDIPLQSGDVLYIPTFHERVALQGEVREPAQYELREGETLQDALSFAGGIKATGISQHVQVSTIDPGNGRVIKDVDFKKSAAPTLALYDGDIVNVLSLRPVVQNKVTIVGAVGQPSDYELTANMHVADLVRAAGNPLSEAYYGHAALYRWNPNGTTTLIPIDLAKALDGDPQSNQPLMKWDQVEVYSRQEAFFTGNHKIIVRGAVQRTGLYKFADNMRVSDLLYKVGGPLPDAEMVVVLHQHGDGTKKYETVSVADVVHGNHAKDIILEDNDVVGVYRNGETSFIPEHKVMVLGAVQTPGLYDRGEGMKLSDLIKLSGDFKPDAGSRVVIAHARRPIDGADSSIRTVAVLFDSQHRCAPQDDVRLEDGDEVLIQAKGGFEDKPGVVTISGLVNNPGPYPITSKKMRLSDLITAAGSLRKEAFPEGTEFYRDPKMMGTKQQRELARIVSDLSDLNNASAYKRELAKSDLERIRASGTATQSSPLTGGSAAPNPAAAALAIELSKHDLVTKPRTLGDDLELTGNIAVNLPEALRRPGGPDDVLLVDGDRITIPETPTTVNIVGAVVNQRGVLYKQGMPLTYYITEAGGFAPDADKTRIVVISAGGGLTPGNQVRTLHPGDVIIVPTRVMAEKVSGSGGGVGSTFTSLLSGLLVFRLLGL
jgi:polysaccharide biosynthesis/export protein